MLPATAKVMFIDSLVVDKKDLLQHLPLSSESGTMAYVNPQSDFVNRMMVYQNQLGLLRVYAKGDSLHSALFTQTKLGNGWSKETEITDFNADTYKLQNYPFLAADGVTLYFSACGSESLGGRDLFMSSFDSDKASWYKPQNMGLPFNSTANDYLLAIDDLDSLGWLVTDRRQPEGKVCIYTFVPTETRENFDDDDLDDEELLPYAHINSIRATWKFGNRPAALKRRDDMLKRIAEKNSKAKSMTFVVNDDRVITSPSQFRDEKCRNLYRQVQELTEMIAATQDSLAAMRDRWHKGDHSLAPKILKAERDLDRQKEDLYNLNNKIRKIELHYE